MIRDIVRPCGMPPEITSYSSSNARRGCFSSSVPNHSTFDLYNLGPSTRGIIIGRQHMKAGMLLGACIAVATSGQVEGCLICGLTFELTGAEQIDGIWARLF